MFVLTFDLLRKLEEDVSTGGLMLHDSMLFVGGACVTMETHLALCRYSWGEEAVRESTRFRIGSGVR